MCVCVCVRACVCVCADPSTRGGNTQFDLPLPLPTPAEGTQGQLSEPVQATPAKCAGRSKGEGPYMCAKRGTLPVSWKGQWHATATS